MSTGKDGERKKYVETHTSLRQNCDTQIQTKKRKTSYTYLRNKVGVKLYLHNI